MLAKTVCCSCSWSFLCEKKQDSWLIFRARYQMQSVVGGAFRVRIGFFRSEQLRWILLILNGTIERGQKLCNIHQILFRTRYLEKTCQQIHKNAVTSSFVSPPQVLKWVFGGGSTAVAMRMTNSFSTENLIVSLYWSGRNEMFAFTCFFFVRFFWMEPKHKPDKPDKPNTARCFKVYFIAPGRGLFGEMLLSIAKSMTKPCWLVSEYVFFFPQIFVGSNT